MPHVPQFGVRAKRIGPLGLVVQSDGVELEFGSGELLHELEVHICRRMSKEWIHRAFRKEGDEAAQRL